MIYVTFYQYAAGKIVLERKQVPQDENGKYTFDMSSVTVPAPKTTLKFMGWSLAQGTDASEQEGDTVGSRPLLNNGVVEFTEDTDVYPVYYSGIWIVFVSADTGMGATYVPSYFISADSINASAAKPTDPAMTGYEFDGWFTAPESKEDYIPAETGGSFNFNTSFEDLAGYTNDRGEVVLYGHWKGGDTTYVVYWKQQVGNSKTAVDSEKTYDYAGQTDPISGTTGSVPTPTAAQQAADTGFKYSRYELVDVKDDGTTVASGGIKADGSSILNVYFDRKMIYFRFRANTYANYNGNWTSSSYATTYTGLYGQTWQQADYTTNWPAPGGSNRWGYYAAGNTTIGMSYLGQFIPPEDVRDTNGVDVRFYYSGTSSYTVNLYVQNADGSWPATTNISGRTGGNFNLTDKLELSHK